MFDGRNKWVKPCLAGMLLAAYLTTLTLALTVAVAALSQRAEHNAPAFSANSYTFNLAKDIPGNSAAVSVGSAPATDLDPTDTLTYSLEPLVYMLGNNFDALYTLNTDTGVAAKVSSTTTDFGVGEDMPTGLVWHENKLYMVGKTTDALYTVDPSTGAATRVGIHHRFGIREDEPWGLASDGSTLHMVGSALDHDDDEQTPGVGALYTLNTSTGAATRVGIQDGFGVSENSPAGLSWHNGTLYMLGDDTDALYTVNTTTGTATKVGSATAFGVNDDTPAGLASSGGTLYMTGRSTYALYTLDTDTGVATRMGSATAFGVDEYSPAGMATPYHPSHATNPDFAIDSAGAITYKGAGENTGYRNFLAVVSDGNDKDTAIVQVTVPNAKPAFNADSYNLELPKDTSGSLTVLEVGSVSATDADAGDTVSYSLRPLVYMVGQTNKALYTLDIDTGVATRVDSTTTNFGAVSEEKPTGLAWLNGKMYMTGQTNDTLYTMDVVTGVATKVGASTKFGIEEDQPWGLASSKKDGISTLHMVGSASDGGGETNNAALYTLNTSTGSATRVGEAGDFGLGGDYSPTGLSWHKDTLYMLGQQYRSLYGLNTSDGNAQFNKGAYDFHVSETLPAGLASVDDKLYMTGQTNKVLYQVDIASSLAVRVSNAEKFGVGEDLPAGIAPGYDPSDFVVSSTGAITYNGAARSGGTTLFFLATATDGEHEDTVVVKVTVTTPDAASLTPVPSAFTVGADATEFTLTTNVSSGIKVEVTQDTGTLAMSAYSGTPTCSGTLDIEEDLGNGGKVKMAGCTAGSATVKLLKDTTELASYTVTISPPDTASLLPVPSTFTVGNAATEFTLTTNVSTSVKVKVTQDTGALALSAANGTPSCIGILDVEEDVTDGDKVKIVGCTEGSATVKLLKGTTELASYSVAVSRPNTTSLPPDTASLTPVPSAFTVGAAAAEFTLTTNVSAGIKVKVTQVTDSVALSADSGTPSCGGTLDTEEDVSNGGKVKMVGCTEGTATVKLFKDTTELASYTVAVSPPDTASLSPVPSALTVGNAATEFTLTTNVSTSVKVKVTQDTGSVTLAAASDTPSCSDALDIEEDVTNGGKVKMVGCTAGSATVKLLKDTTELASYTVAVSPPDTASLPPDTASLSPVPAALTVGAEATEFTLTTNVSAGIKVKVTQGTGTVAISACSGTLDIEEDVTNGDKVKIVGCTEGSATVKLLKDTTELASYTVAVSPPDTASLSPEPSTFTVGAEATEFTLTTNVSAGIKVKVTQATDSVALSAASSTPSCSGTLNVEEDVSNGDKVKIAGCTEGDATVKLLKDTTELASYTVAVSPPDTASLAPVPSAFTVGADATEFTLTTNVSAGIKVKVTQATDSVALSAASSTPSCSGTLNVEEDVSNGDKVKIAGCTEGDATVKLLKDTTELASYTVAVSPPDTASLSPEPSALTVGNAATEFTLTTNGSTSVKVKVTQGTGAVAMSTYSGTPTCSGTLDIEEDVTNGGKVKMVGCTAGSATVKLLKDTTELASYTVTISPLETASLSPVPSALTVGNAATEFTLTTNVSTSVKVKVTQDTGIVAMSAYSGTPTCSGTLDIEEDVTNGGKVKMVGCTAGSATVKLLKDTTELASYTVTISPLETASLSPVPSALTVGNAATEFTLTTNVSTSVKVKVTQDTGIVAMSAYSGTPTCSGTLDIEEDLGNGDKVKMVGCTAGSATVKLLKDTTELASYTVTISPLETASLSPEPSAFTMGNAATEFTLTTNVSAGIKVKVTQDTGTVALAEANGIPSCSGTLNVEEDVSNGDKVKIAGCTEGTATVKLLKDTTELASYTVTISPLETASLSPVPSALTVGNAATEFTLTTNVSTSVKVKVTQDTGIVAMSAYSGTPTCSGTLDIEEDLGNGDKVKMVGCTAGSATVKLLKDTTELASYTVTISPLETASLSPVPSALTVGNAATEFTLTTNVSTSVKVKVTQDTGIVAMSAYSGTPTCSGTLDIEEDLGNGDKVKMVGCTAGSATVKLLKDTTELASYTVTISPLETASLAPVPSAFTVGADATEFTLTTNVSADIKVEVTRGTGTVALAEANGIPSCSGTLNVEEDVSNGDKVKIAGCTEGTATVKLLKDTTELASYTVTISPLETATLSPEPSAFTMGNAATEFTLTTNVSAGIKVEVTQGTGAVALAAANGTPSCIGTLDTEEDLGNGGMVNIVGCTAGSATVKLLKDTTELASYTVAVSPPDTASLSPVPSAFTVGAEATEFTLTTNVSAGIKVKVTQATDSVALSAASGTPSCSGTLDTEEDLANGDKVKIAGCTEGTATVNLLKDTTELASYAVTVTRQDETSLSIPAKHSMVMGAVESFKLTTHAGDVWVGVNYDGNNHLGMDGDCPANTGGREANDGAVFGNGDTVNIKACHVGTGEVRIYQDSTELSRYTVTVTRQDKTSLSIPVTHSMDTGTVESFKLTTPTSYLWVGVNYDGKNHLGVGGDCPADNGGRKANDGAVFGNGDTVSIKACSVGTGEVRIYQGITELASYIVTASPSDTASLSPEPSTFTVGNAATEFTISTNVSAGIKVKVAQVTDSVALSAASGTPSCSGTLNVEEDVSNGGKVKIVGCTEGSATVKLLKGTSELASYTVTVPATAGLSPAPVSLNVGESQTFTVMTSIADSLGVWVGVNKGYDTGSLTIDGGSQGSDCNPTGDNNGRVRTNGQSVTIRGCSAGTSTIYIYKYQQMLASYSILVTEMGPLVTEVDPAPLSMDAAYLLPGSLKVGQFHIFTLETSVDDSQEVWVGVNYGGTGNLVIDGHCLGVDNNGMYFSNGDTVVIIACSAGTGDIRIFHGKTILANYTVMVTGAS